MPQLMPLMWVMSTYMLLLLLLIMMIMYNYNFYNKFIIKKVNFLYKENLMFKW